jgi:predicted ATPase/DNA-binding CsgD family transcriptional regulator
MRKPAGASPAGGLPLRGAYANPMTSLVGRERDVAKVTELLERYRLVTLTGPGGAGKTRLAVAVAERVRDRGRPVAFADLADLQDPGLLPSALATVLGLRATAESSPLELVAMRIGRQQHLLVLDNFEQVLAGASAIGELLSWCQELRVLTTSRTPLRLTMEHTYEVQSLPVPAKSHGAGSEADLRTGAVALFLDRAETAVPGFVATSVDLAAIEDLCRRLEGLPLAIELAAARIRHLSPEALLARLDFPMHILTGGPADAPARHRTLADTVAWSYELLDEREATVFARLGVFAGSFTLSAAMDVAGEGLVDSEVKLLDVLGALVDQSLLGSVHDPGSEPRFAMLDTIRAFTAERMDGADGTRHRHALAYLHVAETADAELDGPDQARWKHALADDLDNLRAALCWADERGDSELLLRLVAALGGFWRLHGDLREGSRWLSKALTSELPGLGQVRAIAQRRAARIADLLGDREGAGVLYQDALASAQELDDAAGMAEALAGIGTVRLENGDGEAATAPIEQALEIAHRSGHPSVIAPALHSAAMLSVLSGRTREAKMRYEETAAVARRAGNLRLAGIALANAADLHVALGEEAEAVPLLSEAVLLLGEVADTAYIGSANLSLGLTLRQLGSAEDARPHIDRGAHQARDAGGAEDIIFALEVMAEWLGSVGAIKEALRAWGAAEKSRDDRALPQWPNDQVRLDPARSRDRAAVPRSASRVSWEAGRATGLGPAVDEALIALNAVQLPIARTKSRRGRDRYALTPRELEVLAQLADGKSDPEIGEELFISPKTASVHVANIKGKLGASSRVEIVTTALRLGLTTPEADETPTDRP